MNDQDEFQFRPLTEGLGFHRKSSETSVETSVTNKFTVMPEMITPLPRKGPEPRTSVPSAPAPANTTVDEILKTLNQKKNLDFVDKKKFLNETPALQFKPSSFDLSAALLDGMLIVATTLLCLIILLVVTRIDLFTNLTHPDSEGFIYLSLGALFAGITWVYLVGNRLFLGFTPGEWVFDQRLGKPEQLGTTNYAMKIVARSTALVATGLVLFPFLSFLLNRDLLGKALGTELMKQSRG